MFHVTCATIYACPDLLSLVLFLPLSTAGPCIPTATLAGFITSCMMLTNSYTIL